MSFEYQTGQTNNYKTLVVTNFWPAGNVQGQFNSNVLPLRSDEGYPDYEPTRPPRPQPTARPRPQPTRRPRPPTTPRPVYPPEDSTDEYPEDNTTYLPPKPRPTFRPPRPTNRPRPLPTARPDYPDEYPDDPRPRPRPTSRPTSRPDYEDWKSSLPNSPPVVISAEPDKSTVDQEQSLSVNLSQTSPNAELPLTPTQYLSIPPETQVVPQHQSSLDNLPLPVKPLFLQTPSFFRPDPRPPRPLFADRYTSYGSYPSSRAFSPLESFQAYNDRYTPYGLPPYRPLLLGQNINKPFYGYSYDLSGQPLLLPFIAKRK